MQGRNVDYNPTRTTHIEFAVTYVYLSVQKKKKKKKEISFQINETHKRQTMPTAINKEVTGGAKVLAAVTALKEKQLFSYIERAPEVRGGHS